MSRRRTNSWCCWELVDYEHMLEWGNEEMILSVDCDLTMNWVKDDDSLHDTVLPKYPGKPLSRSIVTEILQATGVRKQQKVQVKQDLEQRQQQTKEERTNAGSGVGETKTNVGKSDQTCSIKKQEWFLTQEHDWSVTAVTCSTKKPKSKNKKSTEILIKALRAPKGAPSRHILIRREAFSDIGDSDSEEGSETADGEKSSSTEANDQGSAELEEQKTILDVLESQGEVQLVHFGPDVVLVTYYELDGAIGLVEDLLDAKLCTYAVVGASMRKDANTVLHMSKLCMKLEPNTYDDAVLQALDCSKNDVVNLTVADDSTAIVEFKDLRKCFKALQHFHRTAPATFPAILDAQFESLSEKEQRLLGSLSKLIDCDPDTLCILVGSEINAPDDAAVDQVASASSNAPDKAGSPVAAFLGDSKREKRNKRAAANILASQQTFASATPVLAESKEESHATKTLSSPSPPQQQQQQQQQQHQAKQGQQQINQGHEQQQQEQQAKSKRPGVAPQDRGTVNATNAKGKQRKGNGNNEFRINIANIQSGNDYRTSIMVKNIPNKYTQTMVLAEINQQFSGTYDFFYLPIDFQNHCNIGYAFINFRDPLTIPHFFEVFNERRWSQFNSKKICGVAYARIQGRETLIQRFEKSSIMEMEKECRPVLFNHTSSAAPPSQQHVHNQQPNPNQMAAASHASPYMGNPYQQQAMQNGHMHPDGSYNQAMLQHMQSAEFIPHYGQNPYGAPNPHQYYRS